MDIYITPLTSHQLKAFKSSKGPASKASQSFCNLGHTAVEMTTSDLNGYENKSDINDWMMFINEKRKTSMFILSKILKAPTLYLWAYRFCKKNRLNKSRIPKQGKKSLVLQAASFWMRKILPQIVSSRKFVHLWWMSAVEIPLPSCSHSSGHTLRGCNACATARPAITDAAARGNVLRDFIQMRSATNIIRIHCGQISLGVTPPEN